MLRSSRKGFVIAAAVLLGASAGASTAGAQYPYPYPGYGGFYPGRQGGYLWGSSQVMNSYGGLIQSNEQSRILREQANQAKIDTKRKAFDERAYERANTPTFTEEMSKVDAQILSRILRKPTNTEVTSGKAQNIIMPYLQGLANRGIQGPPIVLDPAQVQQLNVTSGSSEAGLGLLKQIDHVEWPLILRGPAQEKLAGELTTATDAAIKGKLDFATYKNVTKGVTEMKDDLKKKFYAEEIDGGTYLTGKRFLESLEGSVGQLQQPGAGKFLSGATAARGRTVQELVQNMSSQGLKFAPATPGSEPAYYALYNAMVSYSAGADTGSGFRVQAAPPPTAIGGYPGSPR